MIHPFIFIAVLMFWYAFFDIMAREWAGIDYLRLPNLFLIVIFLCTWLASYRRIDKFMMLVSQVLQDAFLYCQV